MAISPCSCGGRAEVPLNESFQHDRSQILDVRLALDTENDLYSPELNKHNKISCT
jgi:hypothetical protein